MSETERCEITGLIMTQCAHCLGHTLGETWENQESEDLDPGAFTKKAPTIESKFPSKCPACGDLIKKGDWIRLLNIGWCCEKHWGNN